jgi:hypothetical protein
MVRMQYEIVIKNEKIRSYRTVAFIVLLLNLTVFTLLLFYDAYFYVAASSILLTGIYISLRLYFMKKYQRGHYLDQALIFVLAGCWLGLQNYYVVIALVILGIFYHLALQKIKIVFNAEKVASLNFPQKDYDWNEFNNVIIKDSILTLDFKNNHLLQAEIEEPENINENEFNSFAKAQLNRAQVS